MNEFNPLGYQFHRNVANFTGVPVYDLWPFEKGTSLSVKCNRETDPPTKHMDCIKFLVSSKKKCKRRKLEQETSNVISPTPPAESSKRFRTRYSNEETQITGSSNVTVLKVNNKRKRPVSACENSEPVKRQRLNQENVFNTIGRTTTNQISPFLPCDKNTLNQGNMKSMLKLGMRPVDLQVKYISFEHRRFL